MPILNDYSNCKLTFYPMSSLPNKSLQHPRITVLFCMYQYYIAETNSQLGHCDENSTPVRLQLLLSGPSWMHITLWVKNEMLFFHIFFQTPFFFFFLSGQQLHHFSSQLPWNIDIRQWKPMDINPHSEKKRDLKVAAAASKGRLIDRNGMTS